MKISKVTTREEDSGQRGEEELADGLGAFATYDDYLDSHITDIDLHYLEDQDLARQLVELGYRGTGEILKREDFEARQKGVGQRVQSKHGLHHTLETMPKDYVLDPFFQAIISREELIRNGKLTTIIFIRDFLPASGQEISGYIDLAHRLKTEDFEPYFYQKKKLLPISMDLSFYNWDTQTTALNSSPNFQVIADNGEVLLFKNKRDRKVINVDPNKLPGDNTTRTEIKSNLYRHVVFYDHVTRRKC